MNETIEFNTLYHLCNKNKWFTCGSNSQYDKLFEANRNGMSTKELSIIIWVCSENETIEHIESILKENVF